MGLFVAEVPNPAMHMRSMLRLAGKRYTKAYEVAEYAYFTSFFFGRMFCGHHAVFQTITCDLAPLFTKFVSVFILVQSYVFLYRMYFIFGGRVKETTERKQKGIKIHWFEPLSKKELEKCDFFTKKNKLVEKLP